MDLASAELQAREIRLNCRNMNGSQTSEGT
jgi:hypothetical protein